MTTNEQKRFNPNEHVTQIKSRNGSSDYLPVQWRLVWYREQCPQGTIETHLVHLDLDKEVTAEAYVWNSEKRRSEKTQKMACGIAVFKATITDGNGASATGYGSESAADFGDFLEKAETKAIGRALAALGFGTQFAPELNEGHRIVDAPVESGKSEPPPQEKLVAQLLSDFQNLYPAWCSKTPQWQQSVLYKALSIPDNQALPSPAEYTDEHISAVANYVEAKRQEKSKAKAS